MDVLSSIVWSTLSAVEVDRSQIQSETITNDDGSLNIIEYVPWMVAHQKMMSIFPDYEWEFEKAEDGSHAHFCGDSAEVRCKMTICGRSIVTTLPVYEFGGSGALAKYPNTHQINTAKQRCRVKAMAEFGLFSDLYIPRQRAVPKQVEKPHPVQEKHLQLVTEDQLEDEGDTLAKEWTKMTKGFKREKDTKEDLEHFFERFANHLRNLKIDETDQERSDREKAFIEVRKSKGYKFAPKSDNKS